MEKLSEKVSFQSEFRKLRRHLGNETSDSLLDFLTKYNEVLMDNLVKQADFNKQVGMIQLEMEKLRTEHHKSFSSLGWKVAGLLAAQAALIITLIKFLP